MKKSDFLHKTDNFISFAQIMYDRCSELISYLTYDLELFTKSIQPITQFTIVGYLSLCSILSQIVFSALMRAYFLSLPSMTVHGAKSVDVSFIMRSTAFSYSSHFSRLRQSSSVIFHCLDGVFSRSLQRRYCSSLSIFVQNYLTTAPPSLS